MEELDIPHDFLCPIGQLIMTDPVTTADGYTYERDNIEEWLFHQGKDTNPVTNSKLQSKVLTPVVVVRNQIRAFLEKHPRLVDEDMLYLPKGAIFRFVAVVEQRQMKEFEELVQANFHILLQMHPESTMSGIQIVCEDGTHEMLNFAVQILERKGKLGLLDEAANKPLPSHWFPRLLVRELPVAIRDNDVRKIKLIERLGVSRRTFDTNLLDAARLGDLESVQALLTVGASANCVGNEGMTPLIKACSKGWEAVAHELLLKGATVNAVDGSGWSPLHWAVDALCKPLIELLIRRGADLSLRDKSDCTPLTIASRHAGLQEFINSLLYRLLAENQQRLLRLERIMTEQGIEPSSKKRK
jgi:hypothetical protein